LIRTIAPNQRRAFTMVELLVALSITALLLLAMGSAFTSASNIVQASDTFFRSEQQARVALDLITTEVRRCYNVVLPTPPVATTTVSSIEINPASADFGGNTDNVTFAYNNSSATTNPNTITMQDTATGITTVLASNVISASFDVTGGTNTQNVAVVGSITLTMTIQIGTSQVTLSDSAAPRVNVSALYQ
jgi:prepilin-type N-terminal cleavage/methylation domain-containing protein